MKVAREFTVYRGCSKRAKSRRGEFVPSYGRYVAVVQSARVALVVERGVWWVALPDGCTLVVGDQEAEETREAFDEIMAHGFWREWTRDKQEAEKRAIAQAKTRHNDAATARPATYGRKFGQTV